MRFFWHDVLRQISIHVSDELIWHHTLPDGSATRYRNLHCLARQFPDQGHPAQECGLIPVQEAMFESYLHEVDIGFAEQADPHLVAYAQLLSLLPCEARLHLIACEWTKEGQFFDVYRVLGPEEPMVYLNPSLASILPWREIDGQPRLLVPAPGTSSEASAWLTQAIAVRVWGPDHAPVYAYDLSY